MNFTEYQLRTQLLEYMRENTMLLNEMLKRWSDRLGHGLSMDSSLLYDLFGRDIISSFERKFIWDTEKVDQDYTCLYIAPWVDVENPFYVTFAYHLSISPDIHNPLIFALGEENHLLNFLKERVV